MKDNKKIGVILALASGLLAVLTHAYLYYLHYKLELGQLTGSSICNINEAFNCEAVAASKYSQFLGVPMALMGLLANLIFVGYLIYDRFISEQMKSAHRARTVIWAAVLLLASIVMGSISILKMSTFCAMCIATYVFSILGFIGVASSFGFPTKASLNSTMIKYLSVFGAAVFAIGFLIHGMLGQSDAKTEQLFKAVVDDWQLAPAITIGTEGGIKKGASDSEAKMFIVEFADFSCPHCKHAGPIVDAFVKSRKDVQLTFMVWPLDGECNEGIPQARGLQCMLARAYYCSAQKNKGWEAHDWLFNNQTELRTKESFEGRMSEFANEVSLDANEMKACIDSPETQEKVRAMARIGTALKFDGTPAFFVNGKRLGIGQSIKVLEKVHSILSDK